MRDVGVTVFLTAMNECTAYERELKDLVMFWASANTLLPNLFHSRFINPTNMSFKSMFGAKNTQSRS